MNIPHHLRDRPTWRGLPVPYINRLGTAEHAEDWTIRFDRNLGEIAAFHADVPDAAPDLTQLQADGYGYLVSARITGPRRRHIWRLVRELGPAEAGQP